MAPVTIRVYIVRILFYHTKVEVYGRAYSYSSRGIESFEVGRHDYGEPYDTVIIGETFIPRESFLNIIDTIRITRFTRRQYHSTRNNCNTFADYLCKFLCDEQIPSYILGPQKLGALLPLSNIGGGSWGCSTHCRGSQSTSNPQILQDGQVKLT